MGCKSKLVNSVFASSINTKNTCLKIKRLAFMLQVAATKKFYKKPPAPSSRKEEKKAKGIESEAVKAFLEKQKREEDEKGAGKLERETATEIFL